MRDEELFLPQLGLVKERGWWVERRCAEALERRVREHLERRKGECNRCGLLPRVQPYLFCGGRTCQQVPAGDGLD